MDVITNIISEAINISAITLSLLVDTIMINGHAQSTSLMSFEKFTRVIAIFLVLSILYKANLWIV